MKLSGYKEYCQEKSGEVASSYIAKDEEERVFYRNESKMVDDILRMDVMNMTIEPEYDFDTVRIPVNDDQREWLKLHFLNDLKGSRKLLNKGKKKSPMYNSLIYVTGEEGNIDMIVYFLKTINISRYMCKDCISLPPPGYECECAARKRPEVREWSSKEKDEFK